MIDNENRLVSRVEEVFNVWDYVLFGIMLAASCIIGRDPRTTKSWDTEISLGPRSNGFGPLIPDYRNILSMEGFERGKQADYQRLLIR